MKKTITAIILALLGAVGALVSHKRVPLLVLAPLPAGEVGVPYSAPLYQGGKPPYQCSLTSGSLPPGLYLDTSTCYVRGTPTVAAIGPPLVAEAR